MKYAACIKKTNENRYFSYVLHLVTLINQADIASLSIFQWGLINILTSLLTYVCLLIRILYLNHPDFR